MRVPWRTLALAAALIVVAAVNPAPAQTVIVTKAPPGASLELALNQTTVQTGTADDKGVGSLPFTVPGLAAKDRTAEAAVRVFVDVCDNARRVTLIETGWQPVAPAAGCVRHELFGTFAVRPGLTTIVVDSGEQTQAVWIRQGKPPATWLDPNFEPERDRGGPEWVMATGFIPFGGIALGKWSDFTALACGIQVEECNPSDKTVTFRAGVDFWLGKYLAASGSYLKPLAVSTAGAGSGYFFATKQVSDIVTFTGKGALPIGRVRLYGEGGGLYHHTTLTTDQLMDEIVVDIGGVPTTFPGGTQTFLLQTAGWGWMMGGGGEVWVTKKFAIFGELGRAKLSGNPRSTGEGKINDTLTWVVGGVRVHLSGK
jgi:hypothetical protein